MIRSIINRLLGRKTEANQEPVKHPNGTLKAKAAGKQKSGDKSGPKIYLGRDHGIHREQISPNAIKVCETLQAAGFKAFIVGGGVRDSLLGIEPKDFDVATDATPEQVKAEFRRAMIIGRRFRLVHVTFGREIIETATFRALQADAETDEHGRVLRDNQFGLQKEDAVRRDFTVNALYYDPVSDEILDYHGGLPDLEAKLLRMIGDPATRYREDPVRMMRVVRFAAKLQFAIDGPTAAPIKEMASLLDNVPSARLFDETLKLLTCGYSLNCLKQLREMGLHHGLLPLLDMVLEQPEGERFVNQALSNTDLRVQTGKSISPSFLFATLLWPQVRLRWEQLRSDGEHMIPALMQAIDSVFEEQSERLAIQRRYQADMRELWAMQPRFERRNGQMPYKLLEHLRFRAAYDFLLLRCQAGEAPQALGKWWTDFSESDTKGRALLQEQALPETPKSSAPKRRRKRRPTQLSLGQEQGATSAGTAESD
jgi:poly(A) polymerase